MKANTALFAAAVVLLAVFVLSGCAPASPSRPISRQWSKGGTLHRATVAEWRRASYRDRLATSADFMVAIFKNSGTVLNSTAQLRLPAVELETCISELSVTGVTDVTADELSTAPVYSLAAICGMRLKFITPRSP